MAIVITYDVPNKHTELKKALFKLGYSEDCYYQNTRIYLPNTTVFHEQKHPADALSEIKAECAKLNIKLERCITMNFNSWDAIPGEPFK